MHWCVVGTESVFVVAVVDGNLDADTGINEANDSSGNTDVVGRPSVGRTSKSRISS